jgi:hypothetical protein
MMEATLTKWIVKYEVLQGYGTNPDGDYAWFKTKPYDTEEIAEEHARDIRGYVGIRSTHLEQVLS